MEQSIIKQYHCLRCDHKWLPRKLERPRQCPKCKSAWWDIQKENKLDKRVSDKG